MKNQHPIAKDMFCIPARESALPMHLNGTILEVLNDGWRVHVEWDNRGWKTRMYMPASGIRVAAP